MDKMREEFEAWAKSQGLYVYYIECDDMYSSRPTDTAWWAWQASRKALVVELPDWDCYDTPRQAIEACEDRLSAAGVSYDE